LLISKDYYVVIKNLNNTKVQEIIKETHEEILHSIFPKSTTRKSKQPKFLLIIEII